MQPRFVVKAAALAAAVAALAVAPVRADESPLFEKTGHPGLVAWVNVRPASETDMFEAVTTASIPLLPVSTAFLPLEATPRVTLTSVAPFTPLVVPAPAPARPTIGYLPLEPFIAIARTHTATP